MYKVYVWMYMRKYRSAEIIQHTLIFAMSKLAKIFKPKLFIGCLLFAYEFISFSHGKMMTLDHYFKKKVVLTDPNGDLSLKIHPTVIASMHREVEVTQAASTSTGPH